MMLWARYRKGSSLIPSDQHVLGASLAASMARPNLRCRRQSRWRRRVAPPSASSRFPQRPEASGQLGPCTPRLFADIVECLAGHLHETKPVEDDADQGQVLPRYLAIGLDHVHSHEFGLLGDAAVRAQLLKAVTFAYAAIPGAVGALFSKARRTPWR